MLWKRGCVLGLQVCGLGLGLVGCGLVNIAAQPCMTRTKRDQEQTLEVRQSTRPSTVTGSHYLKRTEICNSRFKKDWIQTRTTPNPNRDCYFCRHMFVGASYAREPLSMPRQGRETAVKTPQWSALSTS